MAEHTPGPWEVTKRGDPGCMVIDGPNGRIVATAWNLLGPNGEEPDTPFRANAKLIAAAPALLEACEMALRVVQNPASTQLVQQVDRCRMVYAMQAAIAAATDEVKTTAGADVVG